MAVIKDVALRAGLSVSVVSKYLKNPGSVRADTRARIEEAIAALDYAPNAAARTLRTGRTNSISVVISNLTNPYFAELFEAIHCAARCAGYTVLLQAGDEKWGVNSVGGPDWPIPSIQHVDGCIICFPENDQSAIDMVRSVAPLPACILGWHHMEGLRAGSVVLDVRDGIYQTTRHLIGLGHRDFGYVGGYDWSAISKQKHRGFLGALAEANISFDPALKHYGRYRMETGYVGAGVIFARGAPTAIVAENDVLAVGCIKYCLHSGIPVPERVAVSGFDDIALASMFEPSITSARHPIERMAEAAVNYITTGDTGEQVFTATLTIRHSTDPKK